MIYIKTKHYPFKGFNAITHWPFVFYKVDNPTMRRHENIHGKQQLEMLIILFYVCYFIEWIFRGYRKISFEQEAYENQNNKNYKRKAFAWLKYLKKS